MVRREGSRFGVSTGHSVRRSGHAQTRQHIHSSQNIVIKATADVKLNRAQGQASALLESHLKDRMLSSKAVKGFDGETTLAFSLNKSRRWEAMDTLKKEVGSTCCHGNRITVAEHHIGVGGHAGESDCIAAYDSRCAKSKRTPRKTYANVRDLIADKAEEDAGECLEDAEFGTKNRRRRQRKKVKVDKKTGVQIDVVNVDVSYTVGITAPRHTRLTYPKYGGQASLDGLNDHSDNDGVVVQSMKRGTKKRNKKPSRDLWEDIHSQDTWVDDDFNLQYDEDDGRIENEAVDNCSPRSEVTAEFGMFVTSMPLSPCSTSQTQRNSAFVSECHKRNTKGRIFVVDSEPTGSSDTLAAGDAVDREEEDAEIHRCFWSSELLPEYLSGLFGDRYQEARSVPRRFAIDVTSCVLPYTYRDSMGERCARNDQGVAQGAVSELMHSMNEATSPMSMAQPVFMLFSFDGRVDREEGDARNKVSVKIVGGNLHPVDIPENVFDFAVLDSPPSVDSSAGEVDETGSDRCCRETSTGDEWGGRRLFVCSLETTRKSLQWDYEIQTVGQLGQEIFKATNGCEPEASSACASILDDVSISCGICCEDINAGAGTALLSCGHWFCSGCWKGYLLARIGQGAPDIDCPEFSCEGKVDLVTIMSLVPSKFFNRYWKQKVNSTVATRKNILRCPSADCRYLARMGGGGSKVEGVRSVAGMAILCDGCHSLWCTTCREEGHWPATCAQAAAYRKEMAANLRNVICNDVIVDYVRYKCCPRCANPIQKASGCQVMTCPCKCVFCWNCGVEWSGHGPTYACPMEQVLHQEYEFDDIQPMRHVYEVAIEHHYRRSKSSSAKRLHSAMDLANTVAIAIFSQNTNHDESLQMTTTTGVRAATFTHVKQENALLNQLKQVMWNADEFLLEADFILEYVEVLLGGMIHENKRVLVQHKNRLAFISQQLDNILHQRLQVDKLVCRQRIESLCRNGKDCLNWLSKGAAKLREDIVSQPVDP